MNLNLSEIILKTLFQSAQMMWPFYFLLLLLVVAKIAVMVYKHNQLSKAGMFEIDKMTGDDFERYLAILFEKLGYSAQIVGSHKGDYGTDLIIEKEGVKTAIQAKRWHNAVGIKSVQEVYGSLHVYNCTKALVVTSNFFTKQARNLAQSNSVELWDRNYLAKIILSTKK